MKQHIDLYFQSGAYCRHLSLSKSNLRHCWNNSNFATSQAYICKNNSTNLDLALTNINRMIG